MFRFFSCAYWAFVHLWRNVCSHPFAHFKKTHLYSVLLRTDVPVLYHESNCGPVSIYWTVLWVNNDFVLGQGFRASVSSVIQSCPTLCSMPGLPVRQQLPEFTQTHVHRVSDAIQPSHPLSSPSPPAPNPSQHQTLFQWVNSSHEVAKVLEFQL